MSRMNSWFYNTEFVDDGNQECYHYYVYYKSGFSNGKSFDNLGDYGEYLITVPGTDYKVSFIRDSICDIHGECFASTRDEIGRERSMPKKYIRDIDIEGIMNI